MMLKVAWRSLMTRPIRAAVLAAGFGFGIAVMVTLLGVGQVILEQAHAPALKGGGLFAPISREGALVLNNVLLTCGCATVFLGTLYPLFLYAVGGPKLSVGFPFFNRTFAPMMVPMINVTETVNCSTTNTLRGKAAKRPTLNVPFNTLTG